MLQRLDEHEGTHHLRVRAQAQRLSRQSLLLASGSEVQAVSGRLGLRARHVVLRRSGKGTLQFHYALLYVNGVPIFCCSLCSLACRSYPTFNRRLRALTTACRLLSCDSTVARASRSRRTLRTRARRVTSTSAAKSTTSAEAPASHVQLPDCIAIIAPRELKRLH